MMQQNKIITNPSKKLAIAKFGGTSMANAVAMKKSASIVCKNSKIKIVVVSATSGTTDQLLKIYEYWTEHQKTQALDLLRTISLRHHLIAKDLNSPSEEIMLLSSLFQEIAQFIQEHQQSDLPKYLDQLLSFGEKISAHLFVSALRTQQVKAQFFDVRKVLITDDHFGKAEPILYEIAQRTEQFLYPLLQTDQIQVVQGFVGATQAGETTTLGRGGSDFSAALLTESLHADELQIWTDVPGIMTMDPRLVSDARIIPQMSFIDAAELANFGAKVLHPATLWPAVRQKARTFVGSTFAPELGGTWIHPDPPSSQELATIQAIALRKNQTLITVTSLRMLNAHGFLAKLFSTLAEHQMSVDLVTTSEVSVALTIDQNSLSSSGKGISDYSDIMVDLKKFCDVSIEHDLTLVAIIGAGISHTPQLKTRTFNAIAQCNVRLICHGASHHNLCFLVQAEQALAVVNKLHQEFIGRTHEPST